VPWRRVGSEEQCTAAEDCLIPGASVVLHHSSWDWPRSGALTGGKLGHTAKTGEEGIVALEVLADLENNDN